MNCVPPPPASPAGAGCLPFPARYHHPTARLRLAMPCFRSATPSCFKHADAVSDSRFGPTCPFCTHFKPPRSPPPTGCRDKRQDSKRPRLRGAAVGQTHVSAKDVRRTMCRIPGMRTSCRRSSWRSSIRISVQGMAAPTYRAYCRRQEGYRFIKQIVARASPTNERAPVPVAAEWTDLFRSLSPFPCSSDLRPSTTGSCQSATPARAHDSHVPSCSITAADHPKLFVHA